MNNDILNYLNNIKDRINESGMYSNCQDDTNWYRAQLELINEIIDYVDKNFK
ncbi:MAG: hypothetical protein J1F35_06525 [Erysipelotrichales bacterium]|nr:hypothetical protein [Erysipelotrichales bacterium]